MGKTIFFDLDGTLTDSAPGIINSVAYALEKMGHLPMTRAELAYFVGPELTKAFGEKCGYDKETALRAIGFFREYFTDKGMWENSPYPGVRELLTKLRDAGFILRVATSKPTVFAERILERFELLPCFSRIDGAPLDESQSGDKDTVLAAALRDLPAAPGSLIVGDRKYDVNAGKKNGLLTVAVTYGYGSPEELNACRPDFTVPTVAALERLLLSL
ncbi:MAG: HAD hydrolase-like protein [Clostridia bacterium]|nr:HAD hydrolase-like protein [Clostridia bacterium]